MEQQRRRDRFMDVSLIFSAFSLAVIYSLRRMSDSDLWGHLACGRYFFERGTILRTYFFNSSWPDFPYVNHEWLFQAVIYGVQSAAGEPGLMALQVSLVVLSFFIVHRTIRLYSTDALIGTLTLALGILSSTHRFLLRPQHFSYVFLVYFLYSLHRYQQGSRRYIYALPLIMVLWVNIHAEALWGLLIPAVFLSVEFLKGRAGSGTARTELKPLLIVTGLIVLAALINPFTWKTAVWPLFVMKEQFGGVRELLPPTKTGYLFFWLYFALVVVTSGIRMKQLDPTWLALSAIFGAIAWTANRGIPHFVFVSAPLLAANLEDMKSVSRLSPRISGYVRNGMKSAMLALLLLLAVAVVNDPRYFRKYDNIPYPDGAITFLKSNGVKGNVFNEHIWGSFLIWSSWPDLKPYIDGRFFHKRFYEEFYPLRAGAPGWEKLFDRYDITIALLQYDPDEKIRLNDVLFRSPGWRLVYWDDESLLYLKETPENRSVIRTFGNNLVNPDRNFLFEYDGWPPELIKQASVAAERNLRFSTSSAKALVMAGNALFHLGDYGGALERFLGTLRYLEPLNAWIFYRISLCYKNLGQTERAVEYLEKCLALAPDFDEGRRQLEALRASGVKNPGPAAGPNKRGSGE